MNMNPLRWTVAAFAVAGAGLLVAGTAMNAGADDKLSALEVACKALDDGDTPDQAYELIVNLIDDPRADIAVTNPELTARTAVDRALAGECG
jgi:hypothetical protein